MKKTISTWMLALILVAGAFVSCSKSGDKPVVTPPPGGGGGNENPPPTNTYFVKMKVDGVQQEFKGTIAAVNQQSEDGYTFVVSATKSANSTEESDIAIFSANPIAAGEYTEGEHDTYFTFGMYAPENASEEAVYYGGVNLGQNVPFKVKITEISDKVVKGTFSGTYYDNGGEGANKKVITEGQFSAPIQD